MPNNKPIRVFSMFTGIGGFEVGLNQSNIKHQLVGYSEIDSYAITIFQKHFKGVKNYGDATTIDETKLPSFDLLVGGFPCQAFSVAGKLRGFNDTRGTLFFDIARILSHKKPKHFILENVRGLLSHDSGRTFQTIIRVLTNLGYLVEWELCNSKNFGVPQNRERVFIIGHLRGSSRPKVFPIRKSNIENQGDVAQTLMARDYKGIGNQKMTIVRKYNTGHDGNTIYSTNGIATTQKALGGGQGGKGGIYEMLDERVRRLTPIETERLQGFPDDWTKGLSDTQRYKCTGNAVTTTVIKEIVCKLYSNI